LIQNCETMKYWTTMRILFVWRSKLEYLCIWMINSNQKMWRVIILFEWNSTKKTPWKNWSHSNILFTLFPVNLISKSEFINDFFIFLLKKWKKSVFQMFCKQPWLLCKKLSSILEKKIAKIGKKLLVWHQQLHFEKNWYWLW
jgi:hypothetical protein